MFGGIRTRRRWARWPVAVLLAAGSAGCFPTPVVEPAGPAIPGPVLVTEIVNQANRELTFSYEFEAADGPAGGGEGLILPCSLSTESWSEITGTYALMIDGDVLHRDELRPGQGNGAFLVVRVRIGPDDEPEMVPPVILAAAPPLGSRELAGCD